jgi:ADP-heptose:LPS heptosyltransferase
MTILSKLRALTRRRRTELSWALRLKLPPWRRTSLEVWSVAGGLGDELMALSVVQAAARKAPSCRLTFHTRHISIMPASTEGLRIVPYQQTAIPADSIGLIYLQRHRLPIIEQMALQLGLRLSEHTASLPRRPPEDLPASFPTNVLTVVIQTVASAWTPNKQWPKEYWRQMIEQLDPGVAVVEVGTETVLDQAPAHPRFTSLVGRTTMAQFVACIQEATVFVGPPSGGMHVAHAYKVPSVVIIGGYEGTYPYPLARQFYSQVPCAPCWLRTDCPYDKKCLRQITPAMVRDAIKISLESAS